METIKKVWGNKKVKIVTGLTFLVLMTVGNIVWSYAIVGYVESVRGVVNRASAKEVVINTPSIIQEDGSLDLDKFIDRKTDAYMQKPDFLKLMQCDPVSLKQTAKMKVLQAIHARTDY